MSFFLTSLSLDSTVPPMLCMAPLADAEWTSRATVTILSDFKDIVIGCDHSFNVKLRIWDTTRGQQQGQFV